ncbi:hypothetical protein F4824DRAFT_505013 [Ustulina deusta]|nr:hypothetical protein F4823DRAFT_563935 [Ustulina deusta]KAI3330517.1 hypothetical protein F4824DRAFT_505013 [Ustulina deusta]
MSLDLLLCKNTVATNRVQILHELMHAAMLARVKLGFAPEDPTTPWDFGIGTASWPSSRLLKHLDINTGGIQD